MALADDFFNVLVDESLEDGNTLWIDEIIRDARTAIRDGKGTVSSVQSSSLNGKSFARALHLSPIEVLQAARRAKQVIDGDGEDPNFNSTYGDFGRVSW